MVQAFGLKTNEVVIDSLGTCPQIFRPVLLFLAA
jgi:hypothetical protein